MRRSLAKFSELEASNHTPSLADFITTTPVFKLSVHTTALIASLKAQHHDPGPPAGAAAAAIATSPQRRPRLLQKLPSDISTLRSKGHLNLVATGEAWREGGRTEELVVGFL